MLKRLYSTIGQIFGENKSIEDYGDPLDFESGFLLDCAIYWVYVSIHMLKYFNKYLLLNLN